MLPARSWNASTSICAASPAPAVAPDPGSPADTRASGPV